MSKPQYIANGSDNVFTASTQAGQALSLALSTTQTGFTLSNPANSGYNLVLLNVRVAFTTAPAGISTVVLAANVNPLAPVTTHTAALTIQNAKLGGGSASVAKADSQCTLPVAPVVIRGLGGPVATGSVSQSQIVDDIDGSIVVTPGCAVSVNALTTAISGVISMTWAEVSSF